MRSVINKIKKYKTSLIRRAEYLKGIIQGNLVNTYWYKGIPNFGDLLNPVLLKYYGMTPINKPRCDADILAIGSILDKVPEDYKGYILGSGLISRKIIKFPNARIIAVRGELTRNLIGAPELTTLGDPGLLISKIYKKRYKKKFVVGLVPHYVDKEEKRIQQIYNRYPDNVLIIDVQRKPKEVFKDVSQCEFILSSSLHGIITADALGIPRGWIFLSDNVLGKGFKFYDYASSLQMDIEPIYLSGSESLRILTSLTQQIDNNFIEEIQFELDKVFRKVSREIIELNRIRND